MQDQLEFDDKGGEGVASHEDDEYKWVGVEDPKVMITTSHGPSSKLKQFAKVNVQVIFVFNKIIYTCLQITNIIYYTHAACIINISIK